jgi:UbiA prenyltransferase family
MKKVIQIIRSNEWRENKLCPLLALGYATTLFSTTPLYKVAVWLLFLLISIIIGAVYVSVINDITDLEDDLASGKRNRMAEISASYRWMIPVFCLALGLLFILFFFKDNLSRLLYLLPWISFSLYSFPPVRLKKRGIWGVFADACGSHLFVSLLMVANISRFTGIQVDWYWFTAVGIWSFFYGLRGILWHQFNDRDNDLKANLGTFASRVDPRSFRIPSMILFAIEGSAFIFMMIRMSVILVFIFLILYLILAFIRYWKWNQRIVLIIPPDKLPYQIFMLDYYQLFFPVSLLIFAAYSQPKAWIVLLVHVILFNTTIRKAGKDLLAVRNEAE